MLVSPLRKLSSVLTVIVLFVVARPCSAIEVPTRPVEGQPLASNVRRVLQSLEYLGAPLSEVATVEIRKAIEKQDGDQLQKLVDEHVLFVVDLNPEVRVKVARGPASAPLQQAGYVPHLVKVINESTVTRQLRIFSPQAGPVYAGTAKNSMERQAQTELLKNQNVNRALDRFLEIEMYQSQPMTPKLSGLVIEYAIALIHSSEAGKREAMIGFDVGSGTQDIGFRGELPILFDVQPAIPVSLKIRDFDGTPTAAKLIIRDALGKVYPPRAKRLAPDFFFQPQIYRHDGQLVLLPPGKFLVTYSRGPEYRVLQRELTVSDKQSSLELKLDRWIDPQAVGFYCGDHHIHAAGCAHYQSPTEGVAPEDMFVQVKGEGLNVGCILTWGPCFDFQRQYFSPIADTVSEAKTLLKYDLEISGFGSAALGHVCLLNLDNQTYPGSEGSKIRGWPTWTVPVMRWAKEQGGVTGYPHSAMHVNAPFAAKRMFAELDQDGDQFLSVEEASAGLLPSPFKSIDLDLDQKLSQLELTQRIDLAADELPNLVVPEMNGAGAMEIFVSVAEGVCDFVSAMDTERIPEWNTWYHLMNCGFPVKLSGETDFPCMSSRSVGQGRVYVQMGDIDSVDFSKWCEGLQKGRSYVSDGYAHALAFNVNGATPGNNDVQLGSSGNVAVHATVQFAPAVPEAVAFGNLPPAEGPRVVGDTRILHAPRSTKMIRGGMKKVELVVNGEVVATKEVSADGKPHELDFEVPIDKSSWVALRQFPHLHTNPVNVIVGGKPIRASRESALWCVGAIKLLWKNRNHIIRDEERPAAKEAYDRAILTYQKIAGESS